ncbi:MAG: hypothetical protein H7338_17650, partial [Candidatus Sericytochromatia bacterium]|nr:hypothetical protein [Candidatus Sericytochromatia bacterium]
MSFEEQKRLRPRILKGPSVSSDVFVLTVADVAAPLFPGSLNGGARPFVPSRLSDSDLIETGLLGEGFVAGFHGLDFASDPEPEPEPLPPPDPTPEILAAAEAQAAEIIAAAEGR